MCSFLSTHPPTHPLTHLPQTTTDMPNMLSMSASTVRMDGGMGAGKQKAYHAMYELMGLGDPIAVTNIIVTKVGGCGLVGWRKKRRFE